MRAALLAPALALIVGVQLGANPGARAERSDAERCVAYSKPGFVEVRACFEGEVDRYGHRVLGKTPEFETLFYKIQRVDETLENVRERQGAATLPPTRVFEDIRPRLADLTGDGVPEAIVVLSDAAVGAQLAVYGFDADGWFEKIAETPFLGMRNRWLAPVGAADFDGDGRLDFAYVETPHIGGILRIWTLRDGALVQLAERSGLSNHRIGQDFIPGGVRDCGAGPQIVTADQQWRETVISWLEDGEIVSRTVADDAAPETLAQALACEIGG